MALATAWSPVQAPGIPKARGCVSSQRGNRRAGQSKTWVAGFGTFPSAMTMLSSIPPDLPVFIQAFHHSAWDSEQVRRGFMFPTCTERTKRAPHTLMTEGTHDIITPPHRNP